MAAYQFVMTTDDGMVTAYSDDPHEFAEAMGAEQTGTENSPGLRAELQGHPKFLGYVGPCWGGITPYGEPIIRYEDSNAYQALSQ